MFWSGNYIAVRELNFLLKEENVSLTQVLEADDILQECKADNKVLMQFLTKPEILAELITLITEEPPKNVEVASQYRHANIACEVLTSHLSMLSDRLSSDTVQMNRLCDFINKDPPLNPLLASYFSKTIEMLLERSPKQDWYLYHIVCLRVLDFFKARKDFLPNLLRHISTSAIADTFKYFIRLDDLFNKIVMEWLEEHQFLESLIQIICGTYVPEELSPPPTLQAPQIQQKSSEGGKTDLVNHKESTDHNNENVDEGTNGKEVRTDEHGEKDITNQEEGFAEEAERAERVARARRVAGVASANAAALLCDLVVDGCAPDGCSTRPRTSWVLVSRLQSERMVRSLLQGMFTSPLCVRRHAVVNGCQVLRALLSQEPILAGVEGEGERTSVELAVAPHLPLLHHALLHDPEGYARGEAAGRGEGRRAEDEGGRVGLARVQVAALLAHLAVSEVEEVPTTMLTLGTPGVLVEMFFKYPNNNFLHAEVCSLLKHALNNRAYRTQYARHLLLECDLLTRLMDAFEENENKSGVPRSGYMGHVVVALSRVGYALEPSEGELPHQIPLPTELMARFNIFKEEKLKPLLQQHDTPLGGYHPAEHIYEADANTDVIAANYDFNDMGAGADIDDMPDITDIADMNDVPEDQINEMCGAGSAADSAQFAADCLGLGEAGEHHEASFQAAKNHFLEMVNDRLGDDMWDDAPEEDLAEFEPTSLSRVHEVLAEPSPWEASPNNQVMSSAGEGWAHFGGECPAPADPFAPASPAPHRGGDPFADDDQAPSPLANHFTPYWGYSETANVGDPSIETDLVESMRNLRVERNLTEKSIDEASSVELANNLLSAMSGMTADAIANIVNANLAPEPTHDTADMNTADMNTADMNTADVNTADTNTADTNTADTNTADTNTADTGTRDTAAER